MTNFFRQILFFFLLRVGLILELFYHSFLSPAKCVQFPVFDCSLFLLRIDIFFVLNEVKKSLLFVASYFFKFQSWF